MAFRKLTVMRPNSLGNEHDAVDIEKIELLKRAKKVLTSTRLKKAYDTKRANKMKISISARSGEKNGSTTSFDEWIDSCSERLSDSDISSFYSSSESGGKCSEKCQLAESWSERRSDRYSREGHFSDHICHEIEPEAHSLEWKETE